MPKFLLISCLALLTAGCGILYKQPIYQGNLLEKSNVEQLQAGMDRQQVLVLLGTPSIEDPFHHDRWDYTATQRVGRIGRTEIKNLTLYFEGDTHSSFRLTASGSAQTEHASIYLYGPFYTHEGIANRIVWSAMESDKRLPGGIWK